MTDRPHRSTRRQTIVRLGVDLVAPVAAYYVLRAMGVSDIPALAAGGLFPAIGLVYAALTGRRVERFALFVLVVIAASTVAAVLTGDARDLLVRHAWLSAPIGGWVLATLWADQPFCFTATRMLLVRRIDVMDRLWAAEPGFRRAWRQITLCWGVMLLLDAALRVVMALELPVAVVPGLDTALTIGTTIALQLPTHLLIRRSGTWWALFGRRPAQPPISPAS